MNIVKIIVTLIWGLFIFEGVRGGLTFPESFQFNGLTNIPSKTKIIMVCFPFIIGLIAPFANQRNPMNLSKIIQKPFNVIFGKDSLKQIISIGNFDILAVIFFLLIGVIGVTKSLILNAPEMNLYFCAFSGSAGLGLLISTTYLRKRNNDQA